MAQACLPCCTVGISVPWRAACWANLKRQAACFYQTRQLAHTLAIVEVEPPDLGVGASMTAPGRPPERGDAFASRHAWPGLPAQAQANRDLLALAICGQTQASALLQSRALASRDAAAAQLHAMRTLRDPSEHAPMSDELQCWYRDAHETAAIASHTVSTFTAQPAVCALWGLQAIRHSEAGGYRHR